MQKLQEKESGKQIGTARDKKFDSQPSFNS